MRSRPTSLSTPCRRHSRSRSRHAGSVAAAAPAVRRSSARLGRVGGMGLLDGKVAIVTGAGRGIGRGEALELAREGAARRRQRARRRRRQAGRRGDRRGRRRGGARHRRLLRGGHRPRAGRHGARHAGAGWTRWSTTPASCATGRVAKMSADEWDAVIRVHLRGHFLPTHYACAHWKELGGRRPHRVHRVDLRAARQLRPGQLRRGQGGHRRVLHDRRDGDGAVRRQCNAIAPAARTRMTESALRRRSRTGGRRRSEERSTSGTRTTSRRSSPSSAATQPAHISGKVFGVQGDAVELYQPFTSVAVIQNDEHPVDARGHRRRARTSCSTRAASTPRSRT